MNSPRFPGKFTLCAKFVPKISFVGFCISPPGYVAINRKLSHIPQIYTHKTIILVKNYSCQFSQTSRKNLHFVQNWSQKLVWWDFEVSSSGYVAINRKLSPIPQIYTLKTTILAKKQFLSILTNFQENLHCVENLSQKSVCGILHLTSWLCGNQ